MSGTAASDTGLGPEYTRAPIGRRVGAYLLDSVASAFVAALFVRNSDLPGVANHLPGLWSLVPFIADYVIGQVLGGQTLGMRMLGLRVVRVDRRVPIGLWRAVLRTVLLVLFIPALIYDRFNRGLHDRLTDTAVVTSGPVTKRTARTWSA